jgi:hypothetical protein
VKPWRRLHIWEATNEGVVLRSNVSVGIGVML